MDNVFAGWSGLADGMATVALDVVGPLMAGEPGRYRRYDWHRQAFAEERLVEPCDVLVIEGVGSGAMAYDEAITCLVYVEAPPDVRLARGLARDGEELREHWQAWRRQEDEMFARERTRERADLVVDGTVGSGS
jgi:uridine kinase